jgi:hypothetical protein
MHAYNYNIIESKNRNCQKMASTFATSSPQPQPIPPTRCSSKTNKESCELAGCKWKFVGLRGYQCSAS